MSEGASADDQSKLKATKMILRGRCFVAFFNTMNISEECKLKRSEESHVLSMYLI